MSGCGNPGIYTSYTARCGCAPYVQEDSTTYNSTMPTTPPPIFGGGVVWFLSSPSTALRTGLVV